MHRVYIALGSNLNHPIRQLQQALSSLTTLPNTTLEKVSPFYQSSPLGPKDQPDYINAVVLIHTSLSPLNLLDHLQNIENKQGRIRHRHWGERTLDLDILLFDNLQIQSDRLTLPHYDMKTRIFVIQPLHDIAPELILPTGEKLSDLIHQCKMSEIQRIASPYL